MSERPSLLDVIGFRLPDGRTRPETPEEKRLASMAIQQSKVLMDGDKMREFNRRLAEWNATQGTKCS